MRGFSFFVGVQGLRPKGRTKDVLPEEGCCSERGKGISELELDDWCVGNAPYAKKILMLGWGKSPLLCWRTAPPFDKGGGTVRWIMVRFCRGEACFAQKEDVFPGEKPNWSLLIGALGTHPTRRGF